MSKNRLHSRGERPSLLLAHKQNYTCMKKQYIRGTRMVYECNLINTNETGRKIEKVPGVKRSSLFFNDEGKKLRNMATEFSHR